MSTPLDPSPWLVEADVVELAGGPVVRQTLIVQSYDGTAKGAAGWAADVLDWVESAHFRSIRPVRGALVEAREDGRLDEAAQAVAPVPSVEGRNLSQAWVLPASVVAPAPRCAVCDGDLDDHWLGSCPDPAAG